MRSRRDYVGGTAQVGNHACFFQGRETWGAYFGSDGRIYASDFWLGFFIVQPPS